MLAIRAASWSDNAGIVDDVIKPAEAAAGLRPARGRSGTAEGTLAFWTMPWLSAALTSRALQIACPATEIQWITLDHN